MFLVIVNAIFTPINIILGISNEEYEVLFNVLHLFPLFFTVFWIFKYCCGTDSFHLRYRINQGFYLQFMSNVVANLAGIIIVIVLI